MSAWNCGKRRCVNIQKNKQKLRPILQGWRSQSVKGWVKVLSNVNECVYMYAYCTLNTSVNVCTICTGGKKVATKKNAKIVGLFRAVVLALIETEWVELSWVRRDRESVQPQHPSLRITLHNLHNHTVFFLQDMTMNRLMTDDDWPLAKTVQAMGHMPNDKFAMTWHDVMIPDDKNKRHLDTSTRHH